MFTHKHYVPVLKWKQGEYQALYRLAKPIKDNLTPLIEIPPIGYDFETKTARKNIDQHLGDFGRRLKTKWQGRRCFVDTKYIDPATRMADKRHFIEMLFENARNEKCYVIPALRLSNDSESLAATAAVIRSDQKGVALRLTLADFDRPNLNTDIIKFLTSLGVGYADTDLIVDNEATDIIVQMMLALLPMIPNLNRWRTFTIVGTSYPDSIAKITPPFQQVKRNEWIKYREFVKRLGSGARIPSFGDYGVAHPDPVDFDKRVIKPYAKLRYTIEDHWYIGKGVNIRKGGFGQYRKLCRQLMSQHYFDGPDYSCGDDYIVGCAKGEESTGNLTTWVWVSINRHLTKVVNDLATFHGLSDSAE